MAERILSAEFELRAQRLARIIINGGKRSDCLRYGREHWGVSDRQIERYLVHARELIKLDWSEIQRPQMIAEILSQYSTLQMEARRLGQLNVAVACINGAARIAQLVS